MSYTQADLDTIRAARLKLLTGERVESITIGTDTVRFALGVTDDQLAKMESTIESRLAGSAGSPRSYAKNGGRG